MVPFTHLPRVAFAQREMALCHGSIATVPVAWLQGYCRSHEPSWREPYMPYTHAVTEPFDRNERFQRSKDWISCASNTLHYLSFIYYLK
jgi:hypothetical protein